MHIYLIPNRDHLVVFEQYCSIDHYRPSQILLNYSFTEYVCYELEEFLKDG